ncbi:replication-relaxation family protein [Streptomyces sp. NBC_00154]|uniref:replication-relaxation family protein n=1 Tax=Streptomyces sp. NBC_00154 TaxID=2975670 RepID=UPI00225B38AC|nr:replication-relaxation family protein [Streptomyces sp. NBC_00154]MCX5315846.1 replication-relaxation family protein [Streptomyces sp. NBC_00154]
MAQVITPEDADSRSYVRRAMKRLAELGLAETSGRDGKHPIWNLTVQGQKALAEALGRTAVHAQAPPRERAEHLCRECLKRGRTSHISSGVTPDTSSHGIRQTAVGVPNEALLVTRNLGIIIDTRR